MEGEVIAHKIFPSPGRCIYCGSDGGKTRLRDEHIIPYSLGGNATIENASCASCEKQTSFLDGFLAYRVFNHLRIHMNIQTRRPENRPTSLSARIKLEGRDEPEDLIFPVENHPHYLAMLSFGPPGILIGLPPSDDLEARAVGFHFRPQSYGEVLKQEASKKLAIHVNVSLNTASYMRAIARIAHCQTVAEYGLDAFKPFLQAAVLGKDRFAPYFVGGELGDPPPPTKDEGVLHRVDREIRNVDGRNLIVITLRLFAGTGTPEHGTPRYVIVSGEKL
jgi:hypothetical protein